MNFLDASIVVAYYLEDAHSERVQQIYGADENLFVSDLVEIEVVSVVYRLVRVGSMATDSARQNAALFDEHLDAGLYGRLHLQSDHYRRARDAITRFDLPLNSPDALHLAAAAIGGFRLVTADRHLARNAEALMSHAS